MGGSPRGGRACPWWSSPRWPSTCGRAGRNWPSIGSSRGGRTWSSGTRTPWPRSTATRRASRRRSSPSSPRASATRSRPTSIAPRSGARWAWPTDAPVVLFVGRLAAQKAVDDLLAALDVLQHVRPDLRALIAGDGPLRDRLEEHAAAVGLRASVKFLGHREDVPRLLAACDLLVLPSLYEGLPNVVLEAMRFRKPVVATAAPGTTEVVADGETGLLVPDAQPRRAGPRDPPRHRGARPREPPGRSGPGSRRGRVPRLDDDRAVRRALRADSAREKGLS